MKVGIRRPQEECENWRILTLSAPHVMNAAGILICNKLIKYRNIFVLVGESAISAGGLFGRVSKMKNEKPWWWE